MEANVAGTTIQTAAALKALIAAERAGQPFLQFALATGRSASSLSPAGQHGGLPLGATATVISRSRQRPKGVACSRDR